MSNTPAKEVRHLPDLWFTVVAEPGEYSVDYTVYDIVGFLEGETQDVYDQPVWAKSTATGNTGETDTLDQAEVYLHGSVKWDGCSNWYFDEQDRGMLHACQRVDLQRFGDAMALCWDWTAELCPRWTYNTVPGTWLGAART